jgi:hypothetical protein
LAIGTTAPRALPRLAFVREDKPIMTSGTSLPEPDVAVIRGRCEDFVGARRMNGPARREQPQRRGGSVMTVSWARAKKREREGSWDSDSVPKSVSRLMASGGRRM